MKKMTSTLIVTFLCMCVSMAQPPKGMGQSDPAAKIILDGVSAKFKTFKSVQAKFSLKIENNAGKNIGTKAGIVYMKGSKYRISITGQEIFCDGNNVWTYSKLDNEVVITKLDLSNNTITPQKLFTNFYDKDFLYKLNGETKGIQEIELTPIDKTKAFYKVLVNVVKANKTIASTKVFEKAGNRYTSSVSSMNTSSLIPDTQFVFDAKKYPGVDVVDNR
jgi:outer membrane lipoprotein carrier protein